MVGKVSDRSFIYCFFGQRCGLAVIFQEFCWTDRFPPWRNVLFALQCSWIQLLPYISSDEYGWYPICSPPLSPYCETVIILLLSFSLHFFCQEKNKTRENFCLGGGGGSVTIFSFFLRFFSLFPLSFSIFHVDLPSHLSFSCVLSKGWACSSLLIYSFIFENKNDDWLFSPLIVYLLVHTCFLSLWLPSSLSTYFLLFCLLLFISALWLSQIPWSPLSSFPSCQPWACFLLPSPNRGLCSLAEQPLLLLWCRRRARAVPLLPAQWHSVWALMWFASFYFGVSPFNH